MSWSEPILLLIALLGSGFYSGIETGVISVNRLRLQHLVRQKVRGADIIQEFVDEPNHLLGTTLVGTNLCNVIISVTSASLAVQWVGDAGLWIASLFSTITLLIFGEYLPKAWFRSFPAYRALPFAGLLKWSGYMFYPLSGAVMQMAQRLIPSPSGSEEYANSFITREELVFLAREGEQTGALSRNERIMMHGIMQLSRKRCADIMISREKMITIRPDTPADQVLEIARAHHLSRLPIHDPKTKIFTGFVHIMDVLLDDSNKRGQARDYARPPQRVDATSPISHVLKRMQLNRQPLALVRNAHDQIIGLISIEDILEEITGHGLTRSEKMLTGAQDQRHKIKDVGQH